MLPSLKMDSPTPAIAVVDENNHEKKEASSRRSNSVHIDTVLFKKSAEEICQENIAYCSRYSLTKVGVFFCCCDHRFCKGFDTTAKHGDLPETHGWRDVSSISYL